MNLFIRHQKRGTKRQIQYKTMSLGQSSSPQKFSGIYLSHKQVMYHFLNEQLVSDILKTCNEMSISRESARCGAAGGRCRYAELIHNESLIGRTGQLLKMLLALPSGTFPQRWQWKRRVLLKKWLCQYVFGAGGQGTVWYGKWVWRACNSFFIFPT